jgi:CRP-like cAMP-binding protein
MEIVDLIKDCVGLTDTESQMVNDAFRSKTLDRKSILLNHESLQQNIYFIENGYFRLYYRKGDKEISFFFFREGDMLINVNAILNDKPEIFTIEAISDSVVKVIRYDEFEILTKKVPQLEKFLRIMLMRTMQAFGYKLIALQFNSAEERYEFMMKYYPDILLNVPLGYIASFLGVTQSTLSVIRGISK